jgi:hypothetical protein
MIAYATCFLPPAYVKTGSNFHCIRPTPTDWVSTRLGCLVCFASNHVDDPKDRLEILESFEIAFLFRPVLRNNSVPRAHQKNSGICLKQNSSIYQCDAALPYVGDFKVG